MIGSGDIIRRVNIDGTDLQDSFIISGDNPIGVAVYGDYIYWTDSNDNTIGRVKKDGSEYNNSFISTGNLPTRIAVGP